MDLSVSPKDEIWFLRLCHYISKAVYKVFCNWFGQHSTGRVKDQYDHLCHGNATLELHETNTVCINYVMSSDSRRECHWAVWRSNWSDYFLVYIGVGLSFRQPELLPSWQSTCPHFVFFLLEQSNILHWYMSSSPPSSSFGSGDKTKGH